MIPCSAYQASRPRQEGGAGVPVGAGQQLRVEQPRVVVDRDVQVLPTRVAAALNSVFADRLTELPEAAELLRVHVQQLAGPARARSGRPGHGALSAASSSGGG